MKDALSIHRPDDLPNKQLLLATRKEDRLPCRSDLEVTWALQIQAAGGTPSGRKCDLYTVDEEACTVEFQGQA